LKDFANKFDYKFPEYKDPPNWKPLNDRPFIKDVDTREPNLCGKENVLETRCDAALLSK